MVAGSLKLENKYTRHLALRLRPRIENPGTYAKGLMLEGVERLVYLTGPRLGTGGDAAQAVLMEAVRSGDLGSLASTPGHFAGTARDGQTVRMARTLGYPLHYFVAKMFHGPFRNYTDRDPKLLDFGSAPDIALYASCDLNI